MLTALWADDPVEFHGEFTDVPPSRFLPKPVQRPRPPILLGATAEAGLRRAGRIADGWISSSRFDLRDVATAVTTVREAAQEAGRDVERLRFVVRGWVQLGEDVRDPDGGRRLLTGSADAVRDDDPQRAGPTGADDLHVDQLQGWDLELPPQRPGALGALEVVLVAEQPRAEGRRDRESAAESHRRHQGRRRLRFPAWSFCANDGHSGHGDTHRLEW